MRQSLGRPFVLEDGNEALPLPDGRWVGRMRPCTKVPLHQSWQQACGMRTSEGLHASMRPLLR